MITSVAYETSREVTSAQVAEVQRRIVQVESGEINLISGDEVLARVRNLMAEHLTSR